MRVFRTVDGEFVAEGDPAAAFLAYTDADDVPDEVLKKVAGVKAAAAPANKARRASGDKD